MENETKDLPDVNVGDLSAMVAQDKGEEAESEGETPEANDGDLDLGSFKNPKDVLKSYKEIQAFTTKVTQENKTLKDQLQSIQEQMDLMRYAAPAQAPQQSHAGNWDFDRAFVENAGSAVAAVAKGVSEATVAQAIRASKIEEVLVEEQSKNPVEFQERFQYAMQIRNQYPNLVNTQSGTRKLFELADKARMADTRQKSERYIRDLMGEDVDFDKFKELVKKDKSPDGEQRRSNAFMPETSGGSKTRSGSGNSNLDKSINTAAAKGDVDTVIQGLFSRVLSETK